MENPERKIYEWALHDDFVTFLRECLKTLNPATPFLPNWHIDAIAYQLDRVRRKEITRLIINMPPRHLKSQTVSVAFPAHLLGVEPWHRIFCISYGDQLAEKHESDFRSIVESAWYQRAFPAFRIKRIRDGEIATTQKGFRRSTTVSGALTGLGGNLFIIDDPQKAADAHSESGRKRVNEWVTHTLMSRLDNKQTGAIVVVMQRVHMDDLSGHLMNTSDDWTVLSLPAIAEVEEQILVGKNRFHRRATGEALHPQYESVATLEKLRRTLGSDVFSAQYQQAPVPPGGAMIKRVWLQYYDKPPERDWKMKVIQSWDTAAKDGAHNDWSVCTTWLVVDRTHYYLLDLTRGRYEYPRLRDTAVALAERFKPNRILIEDASTGAALQQELKRIPGLIVKLIPIDRDKAGRLYTQEAKFEAGLVFFPRGARFLAELEAELLAFPRGKHDDQVDSISQALAYKMSGYDSTYSWV
jgi:predicted phage terminase large subunit-like protein